MARKNDKEAVRPGAPGRVEAMGQTRTKSGQFEKKLPEPIDEAEVLAIAKRREEAIEAGLKFRPTRDEWQVVCREAHTMYTNGHPPQLIALALGLPISNIRRAIAAAAVSERGAEEDALDIQWASVTLMDIVDRALDRGDYEEARKAVMDGLKAKGLVQQGANVQAVQVNVKSEREVSAEVKDWLAKNTLEEGT